MFFCYYRLFTNLTKLPVRWELYEQLQMNSSIIWETFSQVWYRASAAFEDAIKYRTQRSSAKLLSSWGSFTAKLSGILNDAPFLANSFSILQFLMRDSVQLSVAQLFILLMASASDNKFLLANALMTYEMALENLTRVVWRRPKVLLSMQVALIVFLQSHIKIRAYYLTR